MNKLKLEFYVTGFVVAMVIVALFSSVMAVFIAQGDSEYSLSGNHTLSNYDVTDEIINKTKEIEDSVLTDVGGGNVLTDFLDIVGAFFSGGWKALQTTFKSFDLFEGMMNDAATDVEGFSFFKSYITAIILIILFLGVGVGVLLKTKI